MNEEITKLLLAVQAQIDAHADFRKAYNRKMAFDFNMLDFFNIGEVKVTEILAYFLKPSNPHGQGDIFLREFMNVMLDGEAIDIDNVYIKCEKSISSGRRIDLFIRAGSRIIAIENKVWAKDQQNQLKDYSHWLQTKYGDNYLLIYLTPYGQAPTKQSIESGFRTQLEKEKKFKLIRYTNEIFTLLDRWVAVCQAENVSYFIKQFKTHLKTKFLGSENLILSSKMKDLIYQHQETVDTLATQYQEMVTALQKQIDQVAKKSSTPPVNNALQIEAIGPFFYGGRKVFKYGITQGGNKIWVQVYQFRVDIYSSHYFQSTSEKAFTEYAQKNGKLNLEHKLPRGIKPSEIIECFNQQYAEAVRIFEAYNEKTGAHKIIRTT